MSENTQFHVGIRNPPEIRRELLEGTRSIIQLLQRYEKFKKIRSEKREHIIKLRETMKDIVELNTKLKGIFPEVPITEVHQVKEKDKEKEKHKPKENIEINKLEEELDHIESKLAALK